MKIGVFGFFLRNWEKLLWQNSVLFLLGLLCTSNISIYKMAKYSKFLHFYISSMYNEKLNLYHIDLRHFGTIFVWNKLLLKIFLHILTWQVLLLWLFFSCSWLSWRLHSVKNIAQSQFNKFFKSVFWGQSFWKSVWKWLKTLTYRLLMFCNTVADKMTLGVVEDSKSVRWTLDAISWFFKNPHFRF